MPVKLLITRESDASWSQEREFDQEVISIGRDGNSTLFLDDPKKVVSRKHAEMRYEGGCYKLIDCGSHNFTYLNEKRIARNIPYRMESGDTFKIGEFIVKYLGITAETPKRDETVILVNPFHEEMRILEGLLNKLKRNYDSVDEDKREEQLRFAIQGMLADSGQREVAQLLGEEMAGERSPERRKLYEDADKTPEAPASQKSAPETPLTERNEQMFGLLLRPLISLAKTGRKFRNEFIGIRLQEDKNALHAMSEEQLKEYLLGSGLSDEDISEHFEQIRIQLDEVLQYFDAALDLHRIELSEGVKNILSQVDPDQLTEIFSKQIKLPFRVQAKVNTVIQDRIRELMSTDNGVFDSETFAPLFVNRYLKSKMEQ